MSRSLPPRIPAASHLRYEWVPAGDPEAELLLGMEGLFLVRCPIRRRKVVIEAYEPWELRHPDYRVPRTIRLPNPRGRDDMVTLSNRLTPFQYDDFRRGELVCIAEIAVLEGARGWVVPGRDQPLPGGTAPPAPLDTRLLSVLRRNRRHARRRYLPVAQFELELQNKLAAEQQRTESLFDDLSAEFGRETAKVLTPKVSVA